MTKRKFKIAVTGGIGTGKSMVCNEFKNAGYVVINADDTAKEILENNRAVREEIIKRFGDQSYIKDKPNIEHLSEKVFSNEENVQVINSIIHPRTIEKITKDMTKALKDKDIVFVESALIFEANREKAFNYILLVTSDISYQVNRVKSRSNLSDVEILQRIDKQIPDKIKRIRSHFVIENNSTIEELKTKAKFFLGLIERLTG
jgi:dephospho-CoA kinase